MFGRFGCRSELDLGNLKSSDLQTWAIIRNIRLGSGTLVAVYFGRAELVNEFHHTLSARSFNLTGDVGRHVHVDAGL